MGFKRTIRKSINEKYCRDSQQRNLVIKPDGDIIHCEHMYNEKMQLLAMYLMELLVILDGFVISVKIILSAN